MTDEDRDRGRRDRFEVFEQDAIDVEMATGRREETVEQAKRSLLFRGARIVVGTLVTVGGLALLVLPGPGLVVVAIGLTILAQDVPFARRLLDRVKARIPADAEGNVSKPLLFGGLAVSVVAVGFSLWWTFIR